MPSAPALDAPVGVSSRVSGGSGIGLGAPASIRVRVRRPALATVTLAAICLVCVGLPLVVAAITGNLAIPHNDGWAMSRITETFATSGRLRLLNWNDMNLIGQVVMLGPLGASIVVQQAAVALLSVVCLLCAHRLLASSLSRRDALLGTLLVGLWPGWASLSTSFETDVPALAATLAALLAGRRALSRDSRGWLVAAVALSLWAVSIREHAIVAGIAVLGYGWLSRGRRSRVEARFLVTVAGVAGAVLAAFELWRWSVPSGQNPVVTAAPLRFAGDLAADGARAAFTLAVMVAPAVLLAAARHRWGRRDAAWLALGAALVAVAWQWGGVVGHYLSPSGEYAQVLPGARAVIPVALWDTLLGVGSVSAVLLVPIGVRGWRTVEPVLSLFTALAFLEIVVVGAAGHGVFDRYLPALVPGVVALLLGGGPRRRPRGAALAGAAAAVACGLIGACSVLLAANGDAFDVARWRLAQRVAASGVPPERVDAGMEWDGWHSVRGVRFGTAQAKRPGGWTAAFTRVPPCVVVSAVALPVRSSGWTPAGAVAYATYLVGGRSELYLYRTHAAGCRS